MYLHINTENSIENLSQLQAFIGLQLITIYCEYLSITSPENKLIYLNNPSLVFLTKYGYKLIEIKNTYLYNSILGDEVKSIKIKTIAIENRNLPTELLVMNNIKVASENSFTVERIKVYGQKRKRKWDEMKRYSLFDDYDANQEIIGDELRTNEVMILESTDGRMIGLIEDRGLQHVTDPIVMALNACYLKSELDLAFDDDVTLSNEKILNLRYQTD